jgi:uncharacterized protein (DUF433 family)
LDGRRGGRLATAHLSFASHHSGCLASFLTSRNTGPSLHIVTAPDYHERIVLDPEIRFGKPVVRGTRITVGDVLGYLAGGMSEEQVLSDFPQLTREDIRACLAFAADREHRSASVPAT